MLSRFDRALLSHLILAAVMGVFFHFLVAVFWNLVSLFNPITNGLFACCTARPWFHLVLTIHDTLLNILLSLPLALLLFNINRAHVWWLVLSAQLAAFVFWNYHLFYPTLASELLTQFFPSLLRENLSLPFAVIVVLTVMKLRRIH